MKILKNFIVYILIGYLFIGNTFFSYTFADGNSNKCSACNSTPMSMQAFINFEVELLGILQGAEGIAESFGNNKSSGLFAGSSLKLHEAFFKSTMQKAEKNFDSEWKAVKAARITAVLLAMMSVSGVEDSMYSIQILFKDDAFVRDYKTLQELDMAINDIIWDMGISGTWDRRIDPTVRGKILSLQSKYSQMDGNNNSIFERISISSNIKYKRLLIFLLRLNSTMKSMLMAIGENTPVLDSRLSDFEDLYSQGDIVADINKEYIELIKMDYSCVSLKTCSKTIQEARSGMVNIEKFNESFGNAEDTINDAIQNYKNAKSGNGKNNGDKKKRIGGLTDRQVELLHTVYGIDASKNTQTRNETLRESLSQGKKEIIDPFVEAAKDIITMGKPVILDVIWNSSIIGTYKLVKNGVIQLSNRIVHLPEKLENQRNKITGEGKKQQIDYLNSLTEEEKNKISSKLMRQKNIPISEEGKSFIGFMQITVNEILQDKLKDKEIILAGTNQDTHYFIEIGKYIHSIVSEVIGDQNTDGLVKILGEICTYQCTNHGNKCYANK